MGLRETLNEKPGLVAGAAAGILLVAVLLIGLQMFRTPDPMRQGTGNQQFYTTDDGATLFADDATKIPPFDHQGAQAVRAKVFTCDGGKTRFIGYLERYTAEALVILRPPPGAEPQGDAAFMAMESGLEAKRPGDPRWVPMRNAPEFRRITTVTCPDGTPGPLEAVLP